LWDIDRHRPQGVPVQIDQLVREIEVRSHLQKRIRSVTGPGACQPWILAGT